jgi:putative membrane-bound dehydrogenase-like protein
MHRPVLATAAPAAVLFCTLALQSSPRQTTQPEPVLTVPEGFEVERVAGPPLVDRPIVADFDEEGRLYVADSSGSNDKVEKQLAEKPHRIVRLEDSDGDGRFDKSVVFANRMMFPEGAMWFDGSLYVAAPPSIWKLTDTDGDGVADRREEWFEGKTLTGCANDLHGPYLGLDGWMYWTKGAFAQQTYERPGKSPLVTRAAHIFRRHPRGSLVESVMTGGMDNPVDVAFTPAGERILTATFLEHPQLGRRDALIHAVYGGLYGKPHAVIEGHPRTGDLMPELTHLGPAAPSGLTRYASAVFGAGYRDNFFATMFNLQKVTRHVLEPNGASFRSRDSDFLVSSSRDFHPTDVIEDADGSLLVVDTGAWYKLCCPTSQLAAPEVLGAIYRVRRKGAAAPPDPRGRRLAWNALDPRQLAALLDDERPAVQHRVLHQLGRMGEPALSALSAVMASSRSPVARRNAVWALTRIDLPAARERVRAAAGDPHDEVRVAALNSIAVWRDAGAAVQLRAALQAGSPPVRRAAAEALGRTAQREAVPELLAEAAKPLDRALEHSVIFALIEIGDRERTAAGLQASTSRAKRAALIALDQMDDGGLHADAVVPLLDSADPVLKETAWWIATRRRDWGGELGAYFAARLSAPTLEPGDREALQARLTEFGDHPAIQALLATMVEPGRTKAERLTALRAMARTRAKELPAAWAPPLIAALRGTDEEAARGAVAVARTAPVPAASRTDVQAALLAVARQPAWKPDLRVDALAAAAGGLAPLPADLFDLLLAHLAPSQPVRLRAAAAGVVEKAALDRAQLEALLPAVAAAGPLELPQLLRAFDRASGDEALGTALVAAIAKSNGRSAVREEQLRPLLAKYPAVVQAAGDALLASVHVDGTNRARRLQELLPTLAAGDARRGQVVFNSPRAACMACHAIGYIGGKIGPDLTNIGQIRGERDLLEAILYPNASFARGYEPIAVTTEAGDIHTGVLRSDLKDEIVLATGAGSELRIQREQIADMQPAAVSVMPPGLDEVLSRQELADLLAFLKATRRSAN